MPTSFIALQCFQCSIMQVKQQKKSSNKWSCVVCNEKQSVRKVFAQAFMAKDVRKFVQNFNMSRQLSDQKSVSEEHETFNSPDDGQKRKRNDWTEYADGQEESCGKFVKNGDLTEEDDGLEHLVVTEMPKALFKKPKVKEYSSSRHGAETLMKPQFPNRSSAKRHQYVLCQDAGWAELEPTSGERISRRNDYTKRAQDNRRLKEPMSSHPTERALKWNLFRAQIQDCYSNSANNEREFLLQGVKKNETNATGEPIIQLNDTKTGKGAVSKWSSFVTEEDDDNLVESRGRRDYQLESIMNDERVEDDIHPDFL